MNPRIVKITYHLGFKNMNTFICAPNDYNIVKREIEFYLFRELKQPLCEIRIFWIDDDKDEIEIINERDYDLFVFKRTNKSQHLHLAPVGMVVEEPDAASTSNDNKKPLDAATKDGVKEKFDANTSPNPEPQPTSVPVIPSPPLESFAQFLDPQYMRAGIQIFNNLSEMFAKMLDTMENHQEVQSQSGSNSRKNSDAITKPSTSSNFNAEESIESEKDQSLENAKESQTQHNSFQLEVDEGY